MYIYKKRRGQTRIFVLVVLGYRATKLTSKAHAYGVSVVALLLVALKVPKFQEQEYSENAFPIINIYTGFVI